MKKLIYDLGMNDGTDTLHYLSKGYRVLAIEADPELCKSGPRHPDIEILNLAVAENSGTIRFYVNTENSKISSIDELWANREGTTKRIFVKCQPINEIFAEYGVPYYLKIDIEGADGTVLAHMGGFRPKYVSIEDCRYGLVYLERLFDLGYKRFQIVEQSEAPSKFGDDLDWLAYGACFAKYLNTVRGIDGLKKVEKHRWFDIHASMG